MSYTKIYNIQRFPAVRYNTDRKALSLSIQQLVSLIGEVTLVASNYY